MDIILTHVHSDFDALASTIAAAKLYPGSVPILHKQVDSMVEDYVAVHKDALGLRGLDQIDPRQVQRVIVVDTQSRSRLGDLPAEYDRPEIEWVVYDHHPHAEGDFPPTPGHRELIGACSTLLVEALMTRDVTLSRLEATTIALGVYVDTGNLTFASTTPRDARAVAWLLEHGADVQIISQYNQAILGEEQKALLAALIEAAEPFSLRGHTTLLAGIRWPKNVEGIAIVTHKLIDLLSLDVAIVVVEMEGKRTQFVGRSRFADVDVRSLLEPFGARGHQQAASAHVKNMPLEAIMATLRQELPEQVPPEPTAADLMSAPVRTIGPDTSVAEASAALLRYGHNAFPVVEDGRLTGLVSRRDLDRAGHHGLGHVTIKGLMSRKVHTVAPETPVSEIERLMIEHGIGRLPVMHGDALVGLVTRTDVLRVLYAHREVRRHAVRLTITEVRHRLTEIWPKPWFELVQQVGELAGDRPVYLVGGAVRDLLLGKPNLDVDLVVDVDALPLAREVAAAFPGSELSVHEKFGTARLTLADGRKVDFATARTEYYEHPAALPTVDYSSIKQDLARRDFSVNAMAIRLNAPHFGELLDFFASRDELEKRTLRVLHNLSFIEDPTRLFRAVRFEQQLGFTLDDQSEQFARYAMATGRFDGIGGERNKVELRRILSLPNPLPAAKRLTDLDGWRVVDPGLSPGPDQWRAFVRARRLFRLFSPGEAHRWLTYLTILLAELPLDRVEPALGRLNVAKHDQADVLDALRAAAEFKVAEPLGDLAPSALYHRLEELSVPVLVYLGVVAAHPADRRALIRYWQELRPVQLSVSGTDLRRLGLPPGPRYGQILSAVLDARLNGEVTTPDQEARLLEQLARTPHEEQR